MKKARITSIVGLTLALLLVFSMGAIPAFASNNSAQLVANIATQQSVYPGQLVPQSNSSKSIQPDATGNGGTVNYLIGGNATAGVPDTGYVTIQSTTGSILGGQVTIWWGDNTSPGIYSVPVGLNGYVKFPVGHVFANPGTYTTVLTGYVYTVFGLKNTIIPIYVTVSVS